MTKAATRSRQWRRQLDETYSVLAAIRDGRSTDEIGNRFLSFASDFGSTNVLAGAIPPPNASRREQLSHVVLNIWPEEWSERYFSGGYVYRDPTIRLVSQGTGPFLWSEIEDLCSVDRFGRRVMDEAAEFNLREGLTFSFSTLERRAIGFSIAGERLQLSPSERLTFQLVAAYAFGQASILIDGRSEREPVHLSPRQRDVLHWVSEGLSVEAIAERLSISSHTVDSHLRVVREKFGVTSSIHAVAEGFRLGLLR